MIAALKIHSDEETTVQHGRRRRGSSPEQDEAATGSEEEQTQSHTARGGDEDEARGEGESEQPFSPIRTRSKVKAKEPAQLYPSLAKWGIERPGERKRHPVGMDETVETFPMYAVANPNYHPVDDNRPTSFDHPKMQHSQPCHLVANPRRWRSSSVPSKNRSLLQTKTRSYGHSPNRRRCRFCRWFVIKDTRGKEQYGLCSCQPK